MPKSKYRVYFTVSNAQDERSVTEESMIVSVDDTERLLSYLHSDLMLPSHEYVNITSVEKLNDV